MSNAVVGINIVRRPSPFAPHATKTKSFVTLDGSVADLRKVLLEDQVIQPSDKFYIDGRTLAKTSEQHLKWTDVLREIVVVGNENGQTSNDTPEIDSCTCKTHTHAHAVQLPITTPEIKVTQVQHVVKSPSYDVLHSDSSDVSDARTLTDHTRMIKSACTCHKCQTLEQPTAVLPQVRVFEPVAIAAQHVLKKTVAHELPVLQKLEPTADIECCSCQTSPVNGSFDLPSPIIEPHAEVPVEQTVVQALRAPCPRFDVTDGCHEKIEAVVEVPPASAGASAPAPALVTCPCEACQNLQHTTIAPVPVIKVAVEEPATQLPRGVNAFTDVERKLLLLKSGLGSGIDIHEPSSPNPTHLPVVEQFTIADIHFADTESGIEDVIVTSTSRATAYAKSGWVKDLSVEHPWVSDEVEDCAKTATVAVTGRYVESKCQVGFTAGRSLHPGFKKAIYDALAIQSRSKRSAQLGEVFRRYGHVYVTSVELGGMKHATCNRNISRHETVDTIALEMKTALSKRFGSAGVGGCPCAECAVEVVESSFEHENFETVGGVTQLEESDIATWRASLANPVNWSVTRTLCVDSVINLFDEATREKILASVPQAAVEPEISVVPVSKVPLHRLFSPRSGEHFYTTKAAEVDNAVRAYGYKYETLTAYILSDQAESTVPLFRIHRGTKHLYTTDLAERATAGVDNASQGTVGYVYATQENGTFPLYRLFNPRTDAHLFTTNINEKQALLNSGWMDEGITCYAYL